MIVENIIDIDKKKKKILLDNEYVFPLYNSEVKKFKLEAGQEIPDLLLDKIEKEVLYHRAKERALYILDTGEKTRKQVEDKLTLSYYPKRIVDKVSNFLTEYGYIDDLRYIELYVNAKSKKKSRRQIECELLQKGIEKNDIREFYADKFDLSEEDALMSLLSKNKYVEMLKDKSSESKVFAAMARKGFNYEEITRCIAKIKELN